MKARPRSVENRVTDLLNEHFAHLHMLPVSRIPVLGRTGPDISINEMEMVVDVKSRKEVPKAIFFPLAAPFTFDGLVAARLANLPVLWDEQQVPAVLDFSSRIIKTYIDHMDEWTRANCPGSVSCVILHRPEMPIGASVVVIYSNSRRRLITNATTRQPADHPCE